jgi:hydroxymethylglutaryl-CoA reductase (NADPH)
MAQNQKMMLTSLRKLFKSHGEFCASQPWEVIVATITFLVCVLTVFNRNFTHLLPYQQLEASLDDETCPNNGFNCGLTNNAQILEIIIVAIFRCLGIIHCFYRFRKIHRIGSSFIMKIAVSYLGLIFMIYSLVVMSLGTPDINVLVDSYFLILLLLDMSKVTRMAQFALSSSHQVRISENLAHSMFVLAPTLVLNTLATTLMMGTGLLTGFQRLELLSRYAIIYQV